MWFTLAILAVIVLLALRWKSFFDSKKTLLIPELTRALAKYMALALIAAFFLTFLQDTIVVVPAGQRGVVFDNVKGVLPMPLKEGMNYIIPYFQEATLMDIRVQKGEFTASAASKDLQIVHATIAVNFHPDPDRIAELYRNVGVNYAEKIIHPAVQEVVKASSALYTAEELITRRDEVKNVINGELAKILKKSDILLQETYLTDFQFGVEFSKAIESKQVAAQDALRAQRDLQRVKIEAEQQVAKARAEAEGLRLQKAAITSELLELRRIEMQKLAIEKWNGEMPQVMMGGTTPFFDVTKLMDTTARKQKQQ
jgi:regulator of protease activity HflC (stomatin/prohibitin superfamily)